MYSCEHDDGGTTGRNDQFRYDGEDFINLDLKTGTWNPAVNDEDVKHQRSARNQAGKTKTFSLVSLLSA